MVAVAALGVAAVAVAFWALLTAERTGRREVTLLVVLGLVVLDTLLYPSYGTTSGLLQPSLGGSSFDLATCVAVLALGARALAPSARTAAPRRIGPSEVLWAAFLTWTAAAGVRGALAGHDLRSVLYEGTVVLHVGLVAVLAAGTPLHRLAGPLARAAAVLAPVALLLGGLDAAGLAIDVDLPLLPGATVRELGPDAVTVLAAVGALAAAVTLTKPDHRVPGLLSALVLLASPLLLEQRAAWLSALTMLAVLGLVAVLPSASPAAALRARGGETLTAVAVLGALLAGALVWRVAGGRGFDVTARIAETLGSTAKQQSAASRTNQWDQALAVAAEHPLLGSGLGTTYQYFEEGPRQLVSSDITHNILLDVLLRSGAVGVVLLLLAVLAGAVAGARTLRSAAATPARAIAAGATAVLLGLLAKGMVESIFEKHRLAVVLGVAVGLVHAAWSQARTHRHPGAQPGPAGLDAGRDATPLTTASSRSAAWS
ncbi:O-antigen ligase [Quadrisphaera sp. DSM 44207]|uniref:O-antigen ligase family protein n=1 Tax=Quadrisphaera sp. DSM 44207 TaxID=1881057 RepID=UPI00115F7E90|nr:O-antigen ligase family protein [Quadrisphaera sp. DSM 44207]